MGVNPKQMQAMLKRMGIKTEEIEATEVIIKRADGKNLVIKNPEVTKMDIHGNIMINITGEIEEMKEQKQENEEQKVEISNDDIELVASQTGKSREEAKRTLEEEEGDIAKAILKLKGK